MAQVLTARRGGLRTRPSSRSAPAHRVRGCTHAQVATPPAVPASAPALAPALAPAPATVPAATRLTARGRLVVAVAVVLVTLVALAMFGRVVAAAADVAGSAPERAGAAGASVAANSSTGTSEIRVRPGDTAWRIALRVAPAQDPRVTVDRIDALNPGVDLGRLRPGQPLEVPAAGGR